MPGISPEDSGKLKQGNAGQMSDVALANSLIEEIGARRHVGDMLRSACRELRKKFPHHEDHENQWTERRLRGWWNNESQTVKHFQMIELFETAEAIRNARDAHAEYKAKTEHLRQMAKFRSTALNRDVVEGQGRDLG